MIRLCFLIITVCAVVGIDAEPGSELHRERSGLYPDNYPAMNFFKRASRNTPASDEEVCVDHDGPPLPAVRAVFTKAETTVFGWPSTGGVWVRACDAIELDFLGVPRFEPSPTKRFSEEEDRFCQRLEWIGARFYETEHDYNIQSLTPAVHVVQSWYGWPGAVPEGGVWALWTRGVEPLILKTGRIGNALTMQERCESIEMLGGRFYAKWEDALEEVGSQSNETDRLIAKANADSLREL